MRVSHRWSLTISGQSGFAVTHAGDGEAGLEQLPLLQPELVILDLMMPGIDGLEVCRRIRALPDGLARKCRC